MVPGIPKHSDIDDIVKLARDRVNAGYDYVLCLVDMDVISGSHEKMEHCKALQKANPDVIFVESMYGILVPYALYAECFKQRVCNLRPGGHCVEETYP